jgi:hypothetical protein
MLCGHSLISYCCFCIACTTVHVPMIIRFLYTKFGQFKDLNIIRINVMNIISIVQYPICIVSKFRAEVTYMVD